MDSTVWFTAARFGLFIHWGLYALPAGEWRGRQVDYIGEWLQHGERIPCAEYATLARTFHPIAFDARAWVHAAKAAGMGYIVYTAKHHEGFAMYRSRVDPFNVADATPFGRDPLAELADACRTEGLRLGVYYSHCVDWRDPHAGSADRKNAQRMWGNDWDFPPGDAAGFAAYLRRKVEPQLTELLTRYGDIALVWFDTPIATLTRAQAQGLRDLVKRLQPDCLVSNRIGHGLGDFQGMSDNQAPAAPCGRPAEACATLNETWGYKTHDRDWKSAGQVIGLLADCAARGCNLLLNIGPMADGRFPARSLDTLARIGEWMATNRHAVIGTRASPLPVDPPGCRATRSATALHLIVADPDLRRVPISGLAPAPMTVDLPPTTGDLPRVATIPLPAATVHDGILREQQSRIDLPAHLARRADGSPWDGWCGAGEQVSWHFRLAQPGRFAALVGCGGDAYHAFNGGHHVRLACGPHHCAGSLTDEQRVTSLSAAHYPESLTTLGHWTLPSGDHRLTLTMETLANAGRARIPGVHLIRRDPAT